MLVDGELSESDRRKLLERLEAVPNGWRACAFAFLEAQCWRQAMASRKPAPREPVPASEPAASRTADAPLALPPVAVMKPRRRASWGPFLAVASSFLLTLLLGLGVQQAWKASQQPGRLAQDVPAAAPMAPAAPVTAASAAPLKTVRVAFRDETGRVQHPVDLPVMEQSQLDDSWLQPHVVLPPEVQRGLEAMGCEVRQTRKLYPTALEDGRQLVVPVDEVEVHYVGNRVPQ